MPTRIDGELFEAASAAGQVQYDEVDGHAQAAIRASWDEDIAARIDGLDFTKHLEASGHRWAEADDDGDVVIHESASKPA